jgi:glycosyltransferase involved in cell wall biosynthesis
VLPVGVLIPTRNAMALLPKHLETIQVWIDLVEEVVVVDSHSCDGTVEFIKEKLPNRRIRFFSHPPGLYQSWNYGIKQISARYTYISTVGDGISREGLVHLMQVADQFSCDVVISPPDFVNEAGEPIPADTWPVHRIISALNLKNQTHIDALIIFAFAFTFSPTAVLGSSASNLYRTAILQTYPFPTEFGTNGDGAWGLLNALRIRLGVTPRSVSYFREHAKSYPLSEYAIPDMNKIMLDAGLKAYEEAKKVFPKISAQDGRLNLDYFIQTSLNLQRWRTELCRHRKLLWPWILNPAAWRARRGRKDAEQKWQKMMEALFASILDENQSHELSNSLGRADQNKQYATVFERHSSLWST